MPRIFDQPAEIPLDLLSSCRPIPLPERLLMCPPTYFDVVDVKNPFMEGNIGRVDQRRASRQWKELKAVFERCGARVDTLAPTPECEDMVFCANQTFVGITRMGERLCVLSRMKHASRQREVPAFAAWFESAGYRVSELSTHVGGKRGGHAPLPGFEGSGDAIWHPGRGLIWGGHGHRTEPGAYDAIAAAFDVPIIRLRLLSTRFYHLDTCFCPIDERTVLINPASLEPRGLESIRRVFERVIECPADEADQGMACNATAIGGRHVVIQQGNVGTTAALRAMGYEVHEVDTGEYLKSGGSVFCMKMYVF